MLAQISLMSLNDIILECAIQSFSAFCSCAFVCVIDKITGSVGYQAQAVSRNCSFLGCNYFTGCFEEYTCILVHNTHLCFIARTYV